MSGSPTQLGPFIGGLNTKSDQSALADNELYVCENFEIDFDGSLRSRPALLDDPPDLPLANTGQGMLLGYHQIPNGINYLIASDGNSATLAFNGTSWITITNTVSAVAITSFNGKLWLLSGVSGQKGGSWDGTTYTADNNMTYGTTIASYRGILYIGTGTTHTNPGRLYYSNPITVSPFWPAAGAENIVDIGYGDGQGVNAILPLNNILVVMRSTSIWSYSWATKPAGASLQPLSTTVGLDNSQAVTMLDGVIYFVYELKAYSMLNARIEQLNERVPLLATTTTDFNRPIAVSVFGNRIVFSFYDQAFVYSTETYTWSTWVTPTYVAVGKMYQRTGFRDRYPTVHTMVSKNVATGAGRMAKVLLMTDGVDPVVGESFSCTAVTRVFDYGTVSQYKRLFWWGVDGLFRSQMAGTVIPVSFQSAVTWGQLLGKTWGQVLNNTWGQPATASLALTSNRAASGSGPQRKFVKMSKSLRFRQVYYRVVFQTDGTSNTAPVKLFGITTFVRSGERVSKTIS